MSPLRSDSHSTGNSLTLKREWAIDNSCFDDSGRFALADKDHVLGAFSPRNSCSETCYLFELSTGSIRQEHWHQPDWVETHWRLYKRGPDRGILDVSATRQGSRMFGAVATQANFASYWELGTSNGYVIETEFGVRAVAVHPHLDYVAVGTGRKVLDSVSQAVAEVQFWDFASQSIIDRLRLPGACVASMLWLHEPEGLMDGYTTWVNDGKRLNRSGPCIILEPGSFKTLLAVITETRNQRHGFVTLIDPQLMQIVAIDEAAHGAPLSCIGFSPPQDLAAGGYRYLESFFDVKTKSPDLPVKMHCMTSVSDCMDLWVNEKQLFRKGPSLTGAQVFQLWEADQ